MQIKYESMVRGIPKSIDNTACTFTMVMGPEVLLLLKGSPKVIKILPSGHFILHLLWIIEILKAGFDAGLSYVLHCYETLLDVYTTNQKKKKNLSSYLMKYLCAYKLIFTEKILPCHSSQILFEQFKYAHTVFISL